MTDTYQLPPEPPVGTRLWDAHGREWVHDRGGRSGWTCGTYPSADWWRATWAGLLAMGPLCTVPPAADYAAVLGDPGYTDLYGTPIPLCDPCHDNDCRPAAPADCEGGECGCGCRGFYLAPIPAPRRSGVDK